MTRQQQTSSHEWDNPSRTSVPTRELQQDRALRTRALVLRCAGEVFAERGYKATSVADIAARAGVTKGAVYFHFANKEVLAVAVVEEHYTRWPAVLEEVRLLRLSALDTMLALLDRAAEAFHSDPVVQGGARLQIEHALIGLPLPVPYVGWIDLVASLLREARDGGQLRPGVVPEAAARAIVTGFFGMQHASATLHQRADLIERWQEMRALFVHAIKA
ncbi:ScbR family autoregulator-binding transcription factor [Peterkaempfera griseoplana]|uniref:ScbR family autoregulator-binding transcription factor n=1 Tax=Peterkaempfera griseoplana TaxID=66896 RepID=UPI0006E252D4|nr:ScbR family autoregulator-binding transcription factor [Peterkaempfera griseoplana]